MSSLITLTRFMLSSIPNLVIEHVVPNPYARDGRRCSNCNGKGDVAETPELIRTREGDQRLPDET